MAQPLKDIGERLDLLNMTLGMFAPGEPGPIAAELVQLGEETLEHGLAAAGSAAVDLAGSPRLLQLLESCERADADYAGLRPACAALLRECSAVGQADEGADPVPHLLAATQAAVELHSFVAARLGRAGATGVG